MSSTRPITRIGGRGVPVRGNDIDTDRIIPARFLRCVTFEGLGAHAFEDDRVQLAEQGRTHAFDDERFQGAHILVVNSNFGCGSSREHAPQALRDWGISAVVGVSFAEIFFGNTVALGMPCVSVSAREAAELQSAIENDPAVELTLDLEAEELRRGEQVLSVELPDGARHMFCTGQWDATGQLLEGLEEVRATAAQLPYVSGF